MASAGGSHQGGVAVPVFVIGIQPLADQELDQLRVITLSCLHQGGVAILIDALTDNKNRTTQEIKHLLLVHDVELASPGAASWAFTKSGGEYTPNEPLIDVSGTDEERLSTILDTLDEHDDILHVFTNALDYENTGD